MRSRLLFFILPLIFIACTKKSTEEHKDYRKMESKVPDPREALHGDCPISVMCSESKVLLVCYNGPKQDGPFYSEFDVKFLEKGEETKLKFYSALENKIIRDDEEFNLHVEDRLFYKNQQIPTYDEVFDCEGNIALGCLLPVDLKSYLKDNNETYEELLKSEEGLKTILLRALLGEKEAIAILNNEEGRAYGDGEAAENFARMIMLFEKLKLACPPNT